MNLSKSKRGSRLTIALFVLAIGLLLFSTVGGARAALNIQSEVWESYIHTQNIGIGLLENEKPVSGTLLADLQAEGSKITVGAAYPEALSVVNGNGGEIAEYVRVTIYKYWLTENEDGETVKATELDPSLIQLHLVEGSGWIVDSSASTPERTVLYYSKPLEPGEVSSALSDTLTIDGRIVKQVRQEYSEDHSTVTNVYLYDGLSFGIDVEADGVQDHNAEDAILSAWGRAVSVAGDGSLSLK